MAGLQAKVELTVSFGLMMGVMSGRSSGKRSNQLALIKNLENARKIQEEIMKDLKVGDEVLVTDERYECNGKSGILKLDLGDIVIVAIDGVAWGMEKSSLKKINKIMTNEEFDKVQKQTKELIEEPDRKLNEPKEEPKKIGIEITGDVYKVLEKLERLGYDWSCGGEKPTAWKPPIGWESLKYLFMHQSKKVITWDSKKQDCDYIMEDKVFLNNYMIEKPNKEFGKDDFELKIGMAYALENGIVRELKEIKDGIYWSTVGTSCSEFYINWFDTKKINNFIESSKVKEESKKEGMYLVWTPKGSNPRKRHPSMEEAEKEAERLANIEPNKEFYVLKAVKKFMGCTTVESLEL